MVDSPRRGLFALSALLAVLLLASPGSAQPPGSAGGERAFEPGVNLDELFARVAARSPGFGGLYVDESADAVVVHSTNTSAEGRANVEAALRAVFARDLPAGRIEIVEGQYRLGELRSWHARLRKLLAVPGVVSTDIDDRANRLRVGVESEQMSADVRDHIAELGIPIEAVEIVETPPIRFFTSLRTRHRPLVGGLQILFPSGGSSYLCTLGVNAIRGGVAGFVTNSHCSGLQGGVQSTVFFQPLSSSINRIGVETADPGYFTGGICPPGMRCRRSDSAFARRDGSVGAPRGALARTASGTYAWNGTNRFRIVREAEPFVGQTVTKVGRTTGRTQGSVSQVCTDYAVTGTNIVLLCQAGARLKSGGGDSGAPVFRVTNNPAANDVTLEGLLWGGDDFGFMVFSTIGQIQRSTGPAELGPITTCATGFSC